MIYHGGNLTQAAQDFNIPIDQWIDLSTGINPHSYPYTFPDSGVLKRLPDESLRHSLIGAASKYYNISDNAQITPIAGTQALLNVLPHLFNEKTSVRILGPTYKEHLAAWQNVGWNVKECHDVDQVLSEGDICIIVNPDNPTGREFNNTDLKNFAERLHQKNGFLIIDAAFADCQPNNDLSPLYDLPNILIIRSFGKFFGLAGIRLGFVISNIKMIEKLNEFLGAWAVSGPALEIGRQALEDQKWIAEMQIQLNEETQKLDKVLSDKGFIVEGGTSLFRFCRCENGIALFEKLAKKGILIRPFQDFREHIRIGLPENPDHLNYLKMSL